MATRSAAWDSAWLAASLRDVVQHTDVVLAGEVVAVDAFEVGPDGQPGIHTRVLLRTAPELLGAEGAQELKEFWMPGGRIGNRVRLLTGQVRFELGETVAVLLYANSHGTLWPASLARSKWLLRDGRLSLPGLVGQINLDRFRALTLSRPRTSP